MAVIVVENDFCLHMSNYNMRHQAMPVEGCGAQHGESSESLKPPEEE